MPLTPEQQRQLASEALMHYTLSERERHYPYNEQGPGVEPPVNKEPSAYEAPRASLPAMSMPGHTWATPQPGDTREVTDDMLLNPGPNHQQLARDAIARYTLAQRDRHWPYDEQGPGEWQAEPNVPGPQNEPAQPVPALSTSGQTWATPQPGDTREVTDDMLLGAGGDNDPKAEAADTELDAQLAAKGFQRWVNAQGKVELRPLPAKEVGGGQWSKNTFLADEGAPAQVTPEAEAPAPAEAPLQPKTFQEATDNVGTSAAALAGAQRAEAETEAAGKESAAQVQTDQAAEADQLLNDHLAHRAEQQKHVDVLTQQFRAMNEDAANAPPPEYKETTKSKIIGALALVGAGIADGFARMGGNTNTSYLKDAQASIDRGIDLDLQRQKEQLLGKKDAAKNKGLELQIARAQLGDTPEADEFARTLVANRWARETAAQSAVAQSADARAVGATIAADTTAKSAKDQATLMERQLHRQRAAGAAGGAGGARGGGRLSDQELATKYDAGEKLSPRESQRARAWKQDHRADESAEARTGAAEAKLGAKADAEREEILPGFSRLPNQRKLTSPDIREIGKIHSTAVGVVESANEAARLWDLVMDPKTPEDARSKARADYERARNDLLSAVSVATDQGTITKADAERTSGAVPQLPVNNLEYARTVANWVKGTNPGAHTLRNTAVFIQHKAEAQLGKTWGVVPVAHANKAWDEYEARKNPAAKPPAATAPAGGVTFVLDGRKGVIPADKADAFQKAHPTAQRQ